MQLVECCDDDASSDQTEYPAEEIPDKVTALKCAYLADFAYEDFNEVQEKINSMSTKFNFHHLKVEIDLNGVTGDADTQGFVAIDKTDCETFIVFRGTESQQDIKNDANIFEPFVTLGEFGMDDYASFLSGFNTALMAVYDNKVKPAVVEALRKGMKVYFVGHSLGGILAAMAAIRTYHEKYANTKYADSLYVYVYGCPRAIGNWKFYDDYNKIKAHSYNFKINNDPVTKCQLRLGHKAPDKVYNLGGEVDSCTLDAHKMSSYIAKLKALFSDESNIPARGPTIAPANCKREEQVGCSKTYTSWCWIRCNPDDNSDWCWTKSLGHSCSYTLCKDIQDSLSCGEYTCS